MEAKDAGDPNTVVGSESTVDRTASQLKTTPTRKRRHRRKKYLPNFDIPGVHKLVLSELSQKIVGCLVGDNVTTEKPWTYIKKELLQDNIDLHNESSEFLPIKNEITGCPGEQILVGYIPDESRDYDEFYLCLTEEATEAVKDIIEKVQRLQEDRMRNAVNRKVKAWTSLGSEAEVDENIVKNNRPLLEVEVESKYPILPFKIHFRFTRTQDIRDGYMELRSTEEVPASINRKRINTYIQASPSVESNEVQTTCTYPSNAATQYEFDVTQRAAASEKCLKVFQDYCEQNMESFLDLLKVNGSIDFYADDYKDLIINVKFTIKVLPPKLIEYLSFVNMNLCGGKKISNITWHPLMSGVLVLSYTDIAPYSYINYRVTEDEVNRAVHGVNPVLLWTFLDDLNPKLILEAPREVHFLSFCPFDGNLLIGGCVNGQIIIWDITNKLERVEEEEILTNDQQRYRSHMHSLMNWMKNIYDVALVRPTVISDLKYSHRGCINMVKWLPPSHRVSKTGKIEKLEEGERSLQFMTAAEDGTVLIWDLLQKPTIVPGGFKPLRKLRRLKKRPDALMVDVSPFKVLHLNLKPIYRINVNHVLENNRPLSILSLNGKYFNVTYETVNKPTQRVPELSERIAYKLTSCTPVDPMRSEFFVGTMEGHFIHAEWEGQEFDSGEIVNYEQCQFVNYGKYHDGPITSIKYSSVADAILSVGGKIFALWRRGFKDRPILWRKCKSCYTYGSWFHFDHVRIKLVRVDGYTENWIFFHKSKEAAHVVLISNGPINLVSTHDKKIKENVFAFCDHRGSCRFFYIPHRTPPFVAAIQKLMKAYMNEETEKKRIFLEWQDGWNKRFAEFIALQKAIEEQEADQPKFEVKEPAKEDKEAKKKQTKINPISRYLDWVQEEQATKNQERIMNIILKKKQLDTEELMKQRAPLKKLEEENELKRRKQRLKLKDADKIFLNTVAMLFPDIIKEKPVPPPDPYAGGNPTEVLKACYKDYQQAAINAQDYVDDNPFQYDFNWREVLKTGRSRRKRLDDTYDKAKHRERHRRYKEERNRQEASIFTSNVSLSDLRAEESKASFEESATDENIDAEV